jgi:hypothetical protein
MCKQTRQARYILCWKSPKVKGEVGEQLPKVVVLLVRLLCEHRLHVDLETGLTGKHVQPGQNGFEVSLLA